MKYTVLYYHKLFKYTLGTGPDLAEESAAQFTPRTIPRGRNKNNHHEID